MLVCLLSLFVYVVVSFVDSVFGSFFVILCFFFCVSSCLVLSLCMYAFSFFERVCCVCLFVCFFRCVFVCFVCLCVLCACFLFVHVLPVFHSFLFGFVCLFVSVCVFCLFVCPFVCLFVCLLVLVN